MSKGAASPADRALRLAGRVGAGLALAVVALAGLDRLFPPPLDEPETGAIVLSAEGVPLRAFPAPEGRWRLPADASVVDPDFLRAGP